MKIPALPRLSDHGSEIVLLGILGVGIIGLLWRAIEKGILSGQNALDAAAFLLILQRIIEAIQGRWTQRGLDRMGQSLANAPPADPPAKEPGA